MEVFANGTAEIRTSSVRWGRTSSACYGVHGRGAALEQVKVLVMDTDKTPDGGPTTASR
ncbi:MAG: hypothetical protein R2838_24070 [Caldilineaceae bacterium]